MGAPDGDLLELFNQMVATRGEAAVRRALMLTPVLSLVRDAGDFDLDTAARAARTDGPYGSLVLEVPERLDDPVEAIWLSRVKVTTRPDLNVIPMPKQQRNRT